MQKRDHVTYAEAFKRQVVNDIETGRFSCANSARKAYGIKGGTTVGRWMREYGRDGLLPKQIRISTMKEQDETKALKKRVKELERALADAYMIGLLNKNHLEIACEKLGTDSESFKKKHATTLLNDLQRRLPK